MPLFPLPAVQMTYGKSTGENLAPAVTLLASLSLPQPDQIGDRQVA